MRSPRLILWLGFGILLVLAGTLALGAFWQAEEISGGVTAVRNSYQKRSAILNDIETDICGAALLMRDHLIDRQAASAMQYRQDFVQLHASMSQNLAELRNLLETSSAIDRLQHEIDTYWNSMEPIFAWTAQQKAKLGYDFLRDQVRPRRQVMLQLIREIDRLNADGLVKEEQTMRSSQAAFPLVSLGMLISAPAALASSAARIADPMPGVLLALILILVTAKLGGEIAERLGLPAVLGELVGGILLGNLHFVFPVWNFVEPLRATPYATDWAVIIGGIAQLGVIILLFEVGLESTVQGMMKVGISSLLVATLGVVTPFALGFGVSWLFVREIPPGLRAYVPAGFSLNYMHMFIGAVLCATSVGITARVFKDLNRLQQKEVRIILGAAVIDDVMGLVVLAVVSGIITSAAAGTPLQLASILRLLVAATIFLGASLALGTYLVPKFMGQAARLRTTGVMLIASLLLAFTLSYLAEQVGLATIVGAFAAGLILEEMHFHGFREDIRIEQLIRPVSTLLVPIFFVLMGIRVHLEAFGNPAVLGFAAGLILAAIAGKQVCGLGIVEKGMDRLTVGFGMIPRGEVGLIFANIGKNLRVLDDSIFSAIVIMVIVTTLITPPLLKLSLERQSRRPGQA